MQSKALIKGQLDRSYFPRPKQSANTLFNFMKRQEYLKQIISKQAILPRYVQEDISYLGIDIQSISIPMTCFCDINMQKIAAHTRVYGRYGIAFHKNWSIKHGIQPIHYINPDSLICKDFQVAFSEAERLAHDGADTPVSDYLFSHLAFMKPLYLWNLEDGKVQNFHDEREWRYIPSFDPSETELPPFLLGSNNNQKSRDSHNLGIAQLPSSWLNFEWSDIKYILVPVASAKSSIIAFIDSKASINHRDKLELISKIVRLDELLEDV
ncbi:MAG: hypothetical protein IJJ99_03280 [Oscillospiraceae bacterium]|nr:hypothetical protein [Oscillospiraceae bacterium]